MNATVLFGIVQTAALSMLLFYFQSKLKKRDARNEEREQARRKEARLSMKLEMACGKLALGCAMALERGAANGEIKEAKEEFKTVKAEYLEFLNTEAFDNLNKK